VKSGLNSLQFKIAFVSTIKLRRQELT